VSAPTLAEFAGEPQLVRAELLQGLQQSVARADVAVLS
jgi:hypothetical protein